MAGFDFNAFVFSPDLNQLDKCKKTELHDIADHYDISVSTSLGIVELISKEVVRLPVIMSNPDPEQSVGTNLIMGLLLVNGGYR